MPSFLEERLKKENLNDIYLISVKQIKDSRSSFFTPYSGAENFVKEEKRVILSSLAIGLSLDKLILLGGVIGAAFYAARGVSELQSNSKESATKSFEYSGEILKASVGLLVLLYVDVLNLVTRSLATVFGNDEKVENNQVIQQ